jgi:hypothetical protein
MGTKTAAGVPPAPGMLHPDPPLPTAGRQSQRPGQLGRFQDRLGARDDDESLKSEEPRRPAEPR